MKISQTLALASLAALGACATRAAPAPEAAPPETAPLASTGGSASALNGSRAGSAEHFQASAPDRVFFALDDYRLSPEARGALDRQAAWLRTHLDARVLVAGNCDERGTREYNLALGARRAAAVKDYLEAAGISPGRIDTISFGKDRPIDPRSSEEGWAINRNAHTVVRGEPSA